uniref:Uncharacterized protein n=1 Tax=Acrobeloides nanus TaxID=290746 RepID=A0A914DPX5_9BILA
MRKHSSLGMPPVRPILQVKQRENDFQSASLYIQNGFLRKQRNQDKDRIFPHFTNATDTKNIEFMFSHAMDIIIEKSLFRAGII